MPSRGGCAGSVTLRIVFSILKLVEDGEPRHASAGGGRHLEVKQEAPGMTEDLGHGGSLTSGRR